MTRCGEWEDSFGSRGGLRIVRTVVVLLREILCQVLIHHNAAQEQVGKTVWDCGDSVSLL